MFDGFQGVLLYKGFALFSLKDTFFGGDQNVFVSPAHWLLSGNSAIHVGLVCLLLFFLQLLWNDVGVPLSIYHQVSGHSIWTFSCLFSCLNFNCCIFLPFSHNVSDSGNKQFETFFCLLLSCWKLTLLTSLDNCLEEHMVVNTRQKSLCSWIL